MSVNDQEDDRTTTECETVTDAGDPTHVSWTISESVGSLAEDAKLNGQPGLAPRPLELPGGAEARVMAGTVLGQRTAVVVAPTAGVAEEGNVVVVQVLNPSGMEKVDVGKLTTIASNVAAAYTS